MKSGKGKLIAAIATGLITTTAGIGDSLYAYSWWNQVRILFPAYGGRYASLSMTTESVWIFCLLSLTLLVMTCVSSTSLICGESFAKLMLTLFIVSGVGTLAATTCLRVLSTDSLCEKMRNSTKKSVSSSTLIEYSKWLEHYTESMSPEKATRYKLFYEHEVCEKLGPKTWIWLGFVIAACISGIVFLVFRYLEEKEIKEALEGTPLTQDEGKYN